MIGTNPGIEPREQPVLRDPWSRDAARQARERPPHALSRLDMPPPIEAIGLAAVAFDPRMGDTCSLTCPKGASYSAVVRMQPKRNGEG